MAPEISVEKSKNMASRTRASVSAEVFGKYHKKDIFNPTVIKKTKEIKNRYQFI